MFGSACDKQALIRMESLRRLGISPKIGRPERTAAVGPLPSDSIYEGAQDGNGECFSFLCVIPRGGGGIK